MSRVDREALTRAPRRPKVAAKNRGQEAMSKQLMIYENATPISAEVHRDLSVRSGHSYAFAGELNSVPLVVAEFEKAGAEYPIVFAGEGDNLAPAAVLGLRENQNLFLRADGGWNGDYVPAFLRRYPFVFAGSGDGNETLTLCIDDAFEGVNTEGRGERLFDSEGNRTQYLNNMLQFTSDYQAQHNLTRAFCARLVALGLLEPATARVTMPGGESLALTGFQRVSTEKLRGLSDATVTELFRSDMLGLIYAHIGSLAQLSGLMRRASAGAGTED